jgi:hypothetical protein
VRQRTNADSVATQQLASARRLGVAVLREWSELAWLLPRQQRSNNLASAWLQRRALWAWHMWLQQRRHRQHVSDTLAACWTNLHLAAAWAAWRVWVVRRQAKAQTAAAVSARWSNLHLAAAFSGWHELVQVLLRRKAAAHTVAGRWRNLHTAAAFGAWRSFAQQRKQHAAVAAAVSARWSNLHLATAFSCWRQAVGEAAGRAAAAEACAVGLAITLLAAAFLEWRDVASRKAWLRRQANEVSGRQRRLYLELAYGGWCEQVAWRAAKRGADGHWRQVVLRSLLALWWQRVQKRAGFHQVGTHGHSAVFLVGVPPWTGEARWAHLCPLRSCSPFPPPASARRRRCSSGAARTRSCCAAAWPAGSCM